MMKSIHVPATAVAALILSLAAGSLAHAQSGPTPQEQMACRSDAGKYCAEHVGKPPQMNACLRQQAEAVGWLPQGGGIARRVAPHPEKSSPAFARHNA
jgi:hypothetical protein